MKVFVKVSDETRKQRFLNEVEFLIESRHPAILRVYDQGSHHELEGKDVCAFPFVITEYLPQTLYDSMRAGLSIAQKLAFSLQLLSGLSFLAAKDPQIVHRDIKPENIFVRGPSCVIGDFGLMKLLHSRDISDADFILDSTTPVQISNYVSVSAMQEA